MSKLHFYYSAMNAGKSTTLLQSNYNYHERGMDTLLFVPDIDTRDGVGMISTRIGLSETAIQVSATFPLYDYIAKALQNNPKIKCILVDEAQFLSKQHIKALCLVTEKLNVPVLAYGLRSDFQGELFEGSTYLLAWADLLIEIKTICHCGAKATMNLRINEKGEAVTQGAQVEVGGNDRYVATCRKHFRAGQGFAAGLTAGSSASPQTARAVMAASDCADVEDS